jgi:hypothetical protein
MAAAHSMRTRQRITLTPRRPHRQVEPALPAGDAQNNGRLRGSMAWVRRAWIEPLL